MASCSMLSIVGFGEWELGVGDESVVERSGVWMRLCEGRMDWLVGGW